jgi:hypothetical protein
MNLTKTSTAKSLVYLLLQCIMQIVSRFGQWAVVLLVSFDFQ